MFQNRIYTAIFFALISLSTNAQMLFKESDSLRGSLNKNRDWFDIQSYDISVIPNMDNKTIEGSVVWKAKAIKTSQDIQVDLQQPLIIDSILIWTKNQWEKVSFKREDNIALVHHQKNIPLQEDFSLWIFYHGKPREAIRPPWDGGWIWRKDMNGKPWVSVACQGLGASVWYPCKDHQSDEPDFGAALNIYSPDGLKGIGNGRPGRSDQKNWSRWVVRNPINNYNIIPYIGDYVSWQETYKGLKGNLDLSYYVLREDSAKAVAQFKEVPKMLEAFEYWMGPYPFYEDGFKLVQSPHLGMEHQSAVAYGNKFKNGYLGTDLSKSGWGLKWDYIIIHESGHEWFANNITTKDIADMWVHEGFTSYLESLYTEYYFGKKAADEYTYGLRLRIQNDEPIIGPYGINREGSGDMYAKGAVMLHTIRKAMNNDVLFRNIMIGLNKTFYHQTVTTEQIENYISQQSGINFSKVFDQYLRTTQIPQLVLQYDAKEKILTYEWKNCIKGFNLPIHVNYQDKLESLMPLDFQPKKRLIQQNQFDINSFAKAIEQLYYVKIIIE
jgi:aminopeptidase N